MFFYTTLSSEGRRLQPFSSNTQPGGDVLTSGSAISFQKPCDSVSNGVTSQNVT